MCEKLFLLWGSHNSHIVITVAGNWILEKRDDIEEAVRRVRKLEREVEERFDKDNVLKSKMT